MILFIGLIIFIFLLIVSIVVGFICNKRYIDLFNENSIDILSNYNYKTLEIKRKRRPFRARNTNTSECSLEFEYPIPWSIFPPEDIIEVYGIKDNNKYLIYEIYWSKENVEKIKCIVNELNKKLFVN
jgi:sucrose-6-phosphate hydrolase SacC (GH32 family)